MVKDVLIIGCGCIGLSTGILLLKTKQYNSVKIWAKDLPPNVTSNKAAALWYPFLSNPPDKVGKWSAETMEYFQKHILNDPKSGTLLKKVNELFRKPKKEDPDWKPFIKSFRRARKDELPEGYADGYAIDDGFVMDTDMYMNWLVDTFKALGGQIEQREVVDIREPFIYSDIVINCTGLGAKELVKDGHMYPTRGQIVVVKNTSDRSIMDEEDYICYVIPRISNTVLGGTAQDHDYNMNPTKQDTDEILKRVAAISPKFSRRKLEILGVKVGLRPSRYEIRLEPELLQDNSKLLIHNYGHGGSGFTVSWGCAQEVLNLIQQNIPNLKQSKSKAPILQSKL
ncbi:D-aspartate oxidase [Tieghemostelium lacteum]|uniref:D-aspartate oxidase n=1 Tax=Tieghemostelium lacteum TaxID=361077 RepID=A0A151Z5Y4_TIELA|nr:D-aspartate oxidase [Tieghemostelium lacteum]|eukprot:KYQ89370.1 D-aspartate oxidase [Tieghemostelium lacteum]